MLELSPPEDLPPDITFGRWLCLSASDTCQIECRLAPVLTHFVSFITTATQELKLHMNEAIAQSLAKPHLDTTPLILPPPTPLPFLPALASSHPLRLCLTPKVRFLFDGREGRGRCADRRADGRKAADAVLIAAPLDKRPRTLR